jgi:hypothetical protein
MITASDAFKITQKNRKIYTLDELTQYVRTAIIAYADIEVDKSIKHVMDFNSYSYNTMFPKNKIGDVYRLEQVIKPMHKHILPEHDIFKIACDQLVEYLTQNGYHVSCEDCDYSPGSQWTITIRWDHLGAQ